MKKILCALFVVAALSGAAFSQGYNKEAYVREEAAKRNMKLITDLLIRMGYEVFRNAKRRTSSGAIQGIIIEDRPGYNPIYIQTRKLEKGSIITSWNMQSFGDAIERKAGRGLLVTNANFSKPAQDYAKGKHIILIDGHIFARLMIVHNFCINVREVVEVKSIDPSAFKDYEI